MPSMRLSRIFAYFLLGDQLFEIDSGHRKLSIEVERIKGIIIAGF